MSSIEVTEQRVLSADCRVAYNEYDERYVGEGTSRLSGMSISGMTARVASGTTWDILEPNKEHTGFMKPALVFSVGGAV